MVLTNLFCKFDSCFYMKTVINLILFLAVCFLHGYGQQVSLIAIDNDSLIKHWYNTSNNSKLIAVEKPNFTPPSISNENSRSAQNTNGKNPNPQSNNNEKTKKAISLGKIAYNTSRKFDLIKFITGQKLTIDKQQAFDIQFNLKANNLKALEKSPFTIEFDLDRENGQKEFKSFQIVFKYLDKENLNIIFTINPSNSDDDKVEIEKKVSTKKVIEDGSIQINLTTTLSKKEPYFTNVITTQHNEDSDSIILTSAQISSNKKIKVITLIKTKIKAIKMIYGGDEKSMPDISIQAIEDNSIYANDSKKTKPTRKALIIANFNYPKEDDFISLGTHPREDALGVKAILEKEDNLYRWETDTLFNLSKNDLQKKLLEGAYTRGFDTLFVYYAGHGLSNNQKEKYQDYWVPDDVNLDNETLKKASEKLKKSKKELEEKLKKKIINEDKYNKDSDSINSNYNAISIEFYNKNLYNIKDVLRDLYTAALHNNNNDEEGTKQKLKILMISDACRAEIQEDRGVKFTRENEEDVLGLGFDYYIWPVVAIGDKTPNVNSWTQQHFIKQHEADDYYYKNSFGSLPHIEHVNPIQNIRANNDGVIKNPINEIKLLKKSIKY